MPILTNFLKLLKPEKNDYVDVEKHISENYDKIDNKMEELSSSNDEKLNKGNVSSEYDTAKKIEDKIKAVQDTADNKLNKGNLPTTITDAKEIYDLLENNGGINIDTALLYLNDTGTKTQGKVYFDKNKRGLFECIKTTTSTVNSTEFFVDISNKASSDRLSNLYNYLYIGDNILKVTKINLKRNEEYTLNEEGTFLISFTNKSGFYEQGMAALLFLSDMTPQFYDFIEPTYLYTKFNYSSIVYNPYTKKIKRKIETETNEITYYIIKIS